MSSCYILSIEQKGVLFMSYPHMVLFELLNHALSRKVCCFMYTRSPVRCNDLVRDGFGTLYLVRLGVHVMYQYTGMYLYQCTVL